MADKKKRGLTLEERAKARIAYETEKVYGKPISVAELSRRFVVKRETLMRYRDDPDQPGGPWHPNGHDIGQHADRNRATVQAAATAKVISIATRKAVEIAEQSGAIDQMAKAVAGEVLKYAAIENLMLEFAEDTLKRALGKATDENGNAISLRGGTHTSEAGERKDAMAAAGLALDKSRELRGKRVGDASLKPDGDDPEAIEKIEFVIVDALRTA